MPARQRTDRAASRCPVRPRLAGAVEGAAVCVCSRLACDAGLSRSPFLLVALTVLTLAAGVALAFAGLPHRHPLRWLHRALAVGLVALSLLSGAWLLAGAAAAVATAGLLATHLPDRDWGLALLFTHIAGAIFLLVVAGLGGAFPGPGRDDGGARPPSMQPRSGPIIPLPTERLSSGKLAGTFLVASGNIQSPPVAASGFSSRAFAPHYPHTEREDETRTCTDCHPSEQNDNNAIMAQPLLQGADCVNF